MMILIRIFIIAGLFGSGFLGSTALANPPGPPPGGGDPGGGPPSPAGDGDKTTKPEEDDFSGTPYTEYGEFNELDDEEEDTRFLKYGRFYGVSLGVGFQFVDGNRGALWQGGFPMFDFKVHYWFDFNLALDINIYTAQQFYNTTVESKGHVDINMMRLGLDAKYYFDTKNLSAPITFTNPYIFLGAGAFYKTENSTLAGTQVNDTSLGVSWGAGLEFTIKPRKTYFVVEGRMSVVNFQDTYTTIYQSQDPSLPNLTGFFYNLSSSLLFTW